MELILDTHVYLWFITDDERLPKNIKALLERADTALYLSSVVVWEIAIKRSIGKITLSSDLDQLISETIQQYRLIPLPISIPHGVRAGELPHLHRDPFDRMLVAQSIVEDIPIVTGDTLIQGYAVKTRWDTPTAG